MSDWIRYFEETSTERNLFKHSLNNRRLIELIAENTPKGGRVLEAGCGTALLSIILADYGFKVCALDLSKEILDYARKRVCLDRISLDLIQGDMLELSSLFEGKFFDTVCHSGVMEHFTDDLIIKGLSEQRKISTRVIFRIPNDRSKVTDKHFGDERFLSNKKWIRLIREAGFRKVKVFGDYNLSRYTYFVMPGIFFHKKLSFWWKYFSSHSIFICES